MENKNPGYKSVRRNGYSQRQRKSFNKKLAKAKALRGETWLPLAEYRALKQRNQETLVDPEQIPSKEKPKEFKDLPLEEKIKIIRDSLCKHFNNPKRCKTCQDTWRKSYKIPKIQPNLPELKELIDTRKIL